MAVYPVVCANEKEAIVKFGTWMHKHYQNSLHLALEMAERDDDGAHSLISLHQDVVQPAFIKRN